MKLERTRTSKNPKKTPPVGSKPRPRGRPPKQNKTTAATCENLISNPTPDRQAHEGNGAGLAYVLNHNEEDPQFLAPNDATKFHLTLLFEEGRKTDLGKKIAEIELCFKKGYKPFSHQHLAIFKKKVK